MYARFHRCAPQGPVLALADTFHANPPLVCLILKLAGDVVEANISLLEARLTSTCAWDHVLLEYSDFSADPAIDAHLFERGSWAAHRYECSGGEKVISVDA